MKQAHVLTVAAAAGLAGVAIYSFSGADAPPAPADAIATAGPDAATADTTPEAAPGTATSHTANPAAGAVTPALADTAAVVEIDRLTAELAGRDTLIATLSERIAALETEIAAYEEAFGADPEARALLADRDTAMAELERLLDERDTTIADLRSDIDARDARSAEAVPTLGQTDLAAADATPGDLLAGDATKIRPQPGEAQTLRTTLDASGTRIVTARPPDPDSTDARTGAAAAAVPGIDLAPIAEVHFESGSSALTVGGQTRALAAAAVLTALDGSLIRLTGHTDTTGSPEQNRRLSEARAQAVADMLVSAGIPAERIEIVPHGQDPDALPIATGPGVREPLNRCVAIWPVSAG